MLLSRHFVFVHLLKSGGTFVKRILFDHAPADWGCEEVGGHPSVHEIPESHRHLPRFGFVRNPWDWYVSCYHYFRSVDRAPLFDQISDNGRRSFAETFRVAMDTEPFRSARVGPLTWFARQTYGEGDSLELLRFEHLREELLQALGGIGLQVPEELERAILAHPPVNATERAPYREYYDPELRDRVAQLDAGLIERFGYRF